MHVHNTVDSITCLIRVMFSVYVLLIKTQVYCFFITVRRVACRFSILPRRKYEVQQNGDLNITCVAVGSPMPTVKWQKGKTLWQAAIW